jgi:small subunit ribosomal protein S16
MLVIRFSRVGKKNKAQFRIAVQEHTSAPTGRHTEIVGSWDPHSKQGTFDKERIEYWLSQGAQASDSVHNLLVKQGIIKDAKRIIKLTSKKKEESEDEKEKMDKENKEEVKTTEQKPEEKETANKTEEKKEDDKKEEEKEEKKEEK